MTPILLLLALLPVLWSDPQAAGTNPEQPATIRGRVTDRASGQPIPRALVRLMRMNSPEHLSTLTDAQGQYEFTGLPPGRYSGLVEAGPFRRTHIEQVLTDPANPAGLLTLKAGEVRDDLNIALARGLAITVRIVDEWGGPLSGLSVRVTQAASGRITAMSRASSTDDRGRLRVYGLAPGRYVVCAEPLSLSTSAAIGSSRRTRFVRTCYPSAGSEADAEPVSVERADLEDLPIVMRRSRTIRISGTVLDSAGAPVPQASVSLSRHESYGGASGASSTGTAINPDGTFIFGNVAPGEYSLESEIGGPNRPEHRRDLQAAQHFLTVTADSPDIEGLVLQLAKTVRVRGRVVLEDPTVVFPATRPGWAPLFISTRATAGPVGAGYASGHLNEDRTFTLEGLFGSRLLQVANVPPGFYVQSIRYHDREIFGVPTEFRDDDERITLEIVLSNRGAVVTGRVTDDVGQPVRAGRVLMFPAAKTRWGLHEYSSGRISRSGTFRLGPQRGGDYIVVVVPTELADISPNDFERLAQLAQGGERITLRGEEERTLDLRIVKPR